MHKHTTSEPELYLVKAFTNTAEGGNAAGVVLNADALTKEQKQAIATSLRLSETAFVSASEAGDCKVEFFTPNRQIPHCGHATVATFGLLFQKGLLQGDSAVKESVEGPRQISYRQEKVFMAQLAPVYTALSDATVPVAAVAASLHLPETYAFPSAPVVASTGIPFLLVQLPDADALRQLEPNQEQIRQLSEQLGVVGYYVFATGVAEADATSRMFAPGYGIPEESATGMAAGPLACYLYDYLHLHKQQFLIQQGYLMPSPSPSQIEVQLALDDNRKITGLMAGGPAYVMKQLELDVVG